MLKNKSKIIAFLMVIILTLTITTVRAENEVTDQTDTDKSISEISVDNTENETGENVESAISESDNFKKGDVYLTGDDITIDYIIDGNLFVIANSVTINSQIGGDAFICAKTINVGEQGYVFSNLFACAQDINISGVVYDLYSFSQNTTINGYIYRDIRIASNSLNIGGVVGRNAFVTSENINFQQSTDEGVAQSFIKGDFNYTSTKEASIPNEAISGTKIFTEAKTTNSASMQSYIMSLGIFLSSVAIIWLLLLWIAPKFLNNTNNLLHNKLLPIVGFGILTPIVASILFILLLLIGITSSIAILELSLLIILITISSAIFVIAINNLVCTKFNISKTLPKLGTLLILSAILWAIKLIPYVGSIITFIASIIGLGIIIISIIPFKDNKASKEEEETSI